MEDTPVAAQRAVLMTCSLLPDGIKEDFLIMTKNRLRAFVAVALALTVALVTMLTACATTDDGKFPDGAEMTLVVASTPEKVYTVELAGMDKGVSLLDVLDAADVDHEVSGTGEMTMLTAVGGLRDLPDGTYIYIYTSVEKDFDVAYASTVEWSGHTRTSSGVGAASMTMEDGCIVYIGTIVYG